MDFTAGARLGRRSTMARREFPNSLGRALRNLSPLKFWLNFLAQRCYKRLTGHPLIQSSMASDALVLAVPRVGLSDTVLVIDQSANLGQFVFDFKVP